MKKKNKIIVTVVVICIIAGLFIMNSVSKRSKGETVDTESIEVRDITAIVSASGQVKAKKTVNISANSLGTITSLAVKEGDEVTEDQFLLQIDPVPLELQVERLKAAIKGAEAAYDIAKANYEKAISNARRIEELYNKGLQSKEVHENAVTGLAVATKELQSAKLQIEQQRAQMRSASHDLQKVTIQAPIAGIVTRLNVEEGENVIMGTMNNPGTVIMTISDMSVIEVELEVDETDVVDSRIGQTASVTLDSYPDKKFSGTVTEIGNSPLIATATLGQSEAVNFKVVVTLDDKVEGVRPGFSATAEIITAKKKEVASVPIQAMLTREVAVDKDNNIIKNQSTSKQTGKIDESKYKKKEMEGVFIYNQGKAEFKPVETGIVGESYFEVVKGLNKGEIVVTGPYKVLRELKDGDKIKLQKEKEKT
ncbi:MAG: hypothetical protein A2Y62_21050 [Candidatus Fischerbacteria bacterium RBG_13_37_8]|uniref:Uncharacterized protein n=1 Tax=Candidatus Fischerbacteria bacterium RBG_13_37_8 TaxID=1817863 RepID=A0A1F5V6B8_9BACT|nr:MAG: hypothetical protein A2Y62_21050 [Candidatus Fischerbacteria bacterium RBG_13_37_8]